MDCLVKRDDNTIAYVNRMHNHTPKKIDTPRPKKPDKKPINKELSDNELIEILRLFL